MRRTPDLAVVPIPQRSAQLEAVHIRRAKSSYSLLPTIDQTIVGARLTRHDDTREKDSWSLSFENLLIGPMQQRTRRHPEGILIARRPAPAFDTAFAWNHCHS
jgi:hypothetical protein